MSFEQLADLNPILRHIDEAQHRTNALKAQNPDAYARFMEGWAIESTYNSNTIEGSTLSLGDTALVYDGIHVDAPLTDMRQAEGGFAALRFLNNALSEHSVLSEGLIKRAHELVFAQATDQSTRGSYRTVEVTGTDFDPTPSQYVSERMEALIASCSRSKKHPVIIAALFHLEFESIHPFANANGQTGHLTSNSILMTSGYDPINIQAESRDRYINAIRRFQENDDPYPFVAFFCANLIDRQKRILALFDSKNKGRPDTKRMPSIATLPTKSVPPKLPPPSNPPG